MATYLVCYANFSTSGKKYGLQKDALVEVILALFKEPNIRFENGQVVWKALHAYRAAETVKGKEADFAGALIINKAQFAITAEGEQFNGSYTFDIAAQRLTGAKQP